MFEGLNLAEDGRQVFDGLLAEIASARRGEFNRRYAQPGLLVPMMPELGPPYDSPPGPQWKSCRDATSPASPFGCSSRRACDSAEEAQPPIGYRTLA